MKEKKKALMKQIKRTMIKDKIFVSGLGVNKSIDEISAIMQTEYKLQKKDVNHNIPLSYHFSRIQYRDANARLTEKIEFSDFSTVSDLVGKFKGKYFEEIWTLFGDEIVPFIFRLGNMDTKSRQIVLTGMS